MPTPTYTLIASSTVGSGGASNINFTSIPNTYTDLLIYYSGRTNNNFNQDWLQIKFNNNSSSYSSKQLIGTGSSVASYNDLLGGGAGFAGTMVGATATASIFGNGYIYIPNYVSSNNKSWSVDSVNEINAVGSETITNLSAGLWANTTAINQITLASNSSSTIQQHSTAYLYGIIKS